MQQITINQISVEELKDIISKIVSCELEKLPKSNTNDNKEIYGTRKQIAQTLHISLPTLNELTKKGVLQGYRLQGRVLYKWADVEKSLKKVETLKYRRGQL